MIIISTMSCDLSTRHEVAEAAGLFSHSVGEGDEKDVFITKVIRTPLDKIKVS